MEWIVISCMVRNVDTHISYLNVSPLHAYVMNFFCERVVNIQNSLPDGTVNFDSFYKSKHSVKRVDFRITADSATDLFLLLYFFYLRVFSCSL